MPITVDVSCDECGNSIDTSGGSYANKYLYCDDCYDTLTDRITDLEAEINELKWNIEERDSVIEDHEKMINVLQVVNLESK